jgi:mRNA interferase RelE/StbE
MRLVIAPAALRTLAKIPAKTARTIEEQMEAVAADPFGAHPNAKKLTGKDGYRLRVGNWRALYTIRREAEVVILEEVLKREEAYR